MAAVSIFLPQQCFGAGQMRQVLEGRVWEALWPFTSIPEILAGSASVE